MTDNIAKSIAKLLKRKGTSKNNGLKVPGEFTHRQFASRIVIHPTSSTPQKNWSRDKYLALADMLRKLGYTVTFVVGPHEAKDWKEATVFANLHTLATFIYESGYLIGNDSLLGHLASNLNIPTLIISDNRTRMHMWRPGWLKGEVLTPPSWLPNMKFLRLRENHWQKFISPRAVLSAFDNLTRSL